MIPHIYSRSFTISADLEVPEAGCEGVIVAEGDHLGGFSLYVQDGNLRYTYSFMGVKVDTLASTMEMPSGKVNVRYEFAADQEGKAGTGGKGRLLINGKSAGENRLDHSVAFRFSAYAGMDIGKDNGLTVSRGYQDKAPFAFTGTINQVSFDLAPGKKEAKGPDAK
jgi:arylsulfatase